MCARVCVCVCVCVCVYVYVCVFTFVDFWRRLSGTGTASPYTSRGIHFKCHQSKLYQLLFRRGRAKDVSSRYASSLGLSLSTDLSIYLSIYLYLSLSVSACLFRQGASISVDVYVAGAGGGGRSMYVVCDGVCAV